jgi:hypothetical protein
LLTAGGSAIANGRITSKLMSEHRRDVVEVAARDVPVVRFQVPCSTIAVLSEAVLMPESLRQGLAVRLLDV